MPPLQLLIKPASGDCNLRCRYCFYTDVMKHQAQPHLPHMTYESIERIVEKAFAYAEQSITIAFQGGEPLSSGLDFFKHYVNCVAKHNKAGLPVQHALQTNGTLLNEDWAAFFHEHHFLLGLSVDGTRGNHDKYRVDVREEGTFGRVWEKVELLRKYQVEFNILTVVTADTARKIVPIYDFYRRHEINYQQYIPCLNPLDEPDASYPFTLTPTLYGDFLCKLFDLWFEDIRRGRPIYLQYFEELLAMLLGQMPHTCGLSGVCAPQFVIEADASVYPCDFYVLDHYRLGNLLEQDFEDIDKVRLKSGFIEESLGISEKCRTCPFFGICRGGCRRNREPMLSVNPATNKGYTVMGSLNRFCPAYERFFAYALPRLQSLAREIRRGAQQR